MAITNQVEVVAAPHLGKYIVFLKCTKGAQNDVATVASLANIEYADLKYDASGVLSACAVTIQNNDELKLTDVTTGDVRGIVVGTK